MIAWYATAVVVGVTAVWLCVYGYRRSRRRKQYDARMRRAIERHLRDQKRSKYPWEDDVDVQDT